MKTKTTYVIALMHVSQLLAQAFKENRHGEYRCAEDFEREADRISLSIFGRAATELR